MHLLNFHFPNSHSTHTKDTLFLWYTVSYLTTCGSHMLVGLTCYERPAACSEYKIYFLQLSTITFPTSSLIYVQIPIYIMVRYIVTYN